MQKREIWRFIVVAFVLGLAAQFLAASMIPDEFRGADGVMPFGPKLEAPEWATAADKLAAYLGRQV